MTTSFHRLSDHRSINETCSPISNMSVFWIACDLQNCDKHSIGRFGHRRDGGAGSSPNVLLVDEIPRRELALHISRDIWQIFVIIADHACQTLNHLTHYAHSSQRAQNTTSTMQMARSPPLKIMISRHPEDGLLLNFYYRDVLRGQGLIPFPH